MMAEIKRNRETIERELLRLRSLIIDEYEKKRWQEVWFFPEWSKVKGFKGTAPIVLVGLNPSTSPFPDNKTTRLYDALKAARLENAHLTDVIKIRARGDEIGKLVRDNHFLAKQYEILGKEIRVIQPELIVAMGLRCYRLLCSVGCTRVLSRLNPRSTLPIAEILHYAYRFGGEKEQRAKKRQLRKVLKNCRRISFWRPATARLTETSLRQRASDEGMDIALCLLNPS